MKVFGYVRVSTEEQAQSGLSIEAQISKIEAYCKLYELELVKIIKDEGFSAKNIKRPGIEEALVALSKKEIEGIVISKLDRLTRNVKDMGFLIDNYFNKSHLFSVSEQVDTRTAGGRLVLNVLVSVAQWEREIIGERTKDALKSKRDRKEHTGGHVPYGFNLENGKLKENEYEQGIIKMMICLKEMGGGLNYIAGNLNEQGIKTKTGKLWQRATIKYVLDRTLRKS